MKEKGRHSRVSGNQGYLKGARLSEITGYFSLKAPAWMPAYAGMTKYDTAFEGRGKSGGERQAPYGNNPEAHHRCQLLAMIN